MRKVTLLRELSYFFHFLDIIILFVVVALLRTLFYMDGKYLTQFS